MNILAQSREPQREKRRVPCQRTIGQAISNRPAAVGGHIAVAQRGESQIDECLGIGLDDGLVGGATVVVVCVPSSA
jgi:hypothetical protein